MRGNRWPFTVVSVLYSLFLLCRYSCIYVMCDTWRVMMCLKLLVACTTLCMQTMCNKDGCL